MTIQAERSLYLIHLTHCVVLGFAADPVCYDNDDDAEKEMHTQELQRLSSSIMMMAHPTH